MQIDDPQSEALYDRTESVPDFDHTSYSGNSEAADDDDVSVSVTWPSASNAIVISDSFSVIIDGISRLSL